MTPLRLGSPNQTFKLQKKTLLADLRVGLDHHVSSPNYCVNTYAWSGGTTSSGDQMNSFRRHWRSVWSLFDFNRTAAGRPVISAIKMCISLKVIYAMLCVSAKRPYSPVTCPVDFLAANKSATRCGEQGYQHQIGLYRVYGKSINGYCQRLLRWW